MRRLGFLVGWLIGLFRPEEEYDPFAIPFGMPTTLNHLLGVEDQESR
jgi:hypothetical protein